MKKQIISYLIENEEIVPISFLKKIEDPEKIKKAELLIKEKAPAKEIIKLFSEEKKELKKEEDETEKQKNQLEILFDYDKPANKKKIEDFVNYYNNRFKQFEKILLPRLENCLSISRILKKTDKEKISFVCIITDKQLTKTNKIILTVEDQTGIIKVLFNQNNPEEFRNAKDLVLDEVIGITGTASNGLFFAEKVTLPEIPILPEQKRTKEESYAIFLGDIHVGSKLFMEKEFLNFISWLKGESGTEEEKEIAKKTEYCFIAGDLVSGVGIYPKQEEELEIPDIYLQYKKFSEYINQIPERIKIIIIPGNHDVGRLSEPQKRLEKDFLGEIIEKKNIYSLSNPSLVNIKKTDNFEGITVLMYHGYSYDYYADTVESIRMSGKPISDRPPLISKFLLQRRHLAPTHHSTLSVPDPESDPLIINQIPDIFVTGHIHKSALYNYRGTTIICTSCWEKQTAYQEKFGHIPDLAKVIAINLNTRQPKIIDFEKQK
jgi:DNA polymerase II small subunit